MCNEGLVFEPTEYPAIFYNSSALRDDSIYHFGIKVKRDLKCLGIYDFIEVDADRYMMVCNIGQVIFISKEDLENRYHCVFAANGNYRIYKIS